MKKEIWKINDEEVEVPILEDEEIETNEKLLDNTLEMPVLKDDSDE